MNNDKADFTQGSILKKLIAFMIPVLGALILQAAYGAVDLLRFLFTEIAGDQNRDTHSELDYDEGDEV